MSLKHLPALVPVLLFAILELVLQKRCSDALRAWLLCRPGLHIAVLSTGRKMYHVRGTV